MNRFLIPVYLVTTAAVATLSGCGAGSKAPVAKVESLQDYFGGTDQAAQQARFERQQRVAEEIIAKCMRAQGFEYTAYVQSQNFQIPAQAKRGEEVAFKRKHGYSFAENMAQQGNFQPQVDNNPNNKRVEKMSEGERNAYQKALYGVDPSKPPVDGQNFQPSGCQSEAYKGQGDAWKPLESKFVALGKKTEADPDIAKLNAKFTSCMKKAGYAISKEQDIYEKILNPKQQKIYESIYSQAPTTDAGSASSGPPPAPPTIPPAKIDEFKTFEMKVANADVDCRPQKDVNKMFEFTQKYEKAFIDENKVLLEKLKASQG
jgi:hypothetical protein